MNGEVTVGFALAFTAGLLSFLSPCVLPLVPSYVGFITGLSLDDVQHARRATLVHTLLFVSGFTLVFLALGASATVFGRLLKEHGLWLSRIGGVVIIVFGLFLIGWVRIGAFARERRLHIADKPLGYLGTVFVGMAFGAGWTPCIGPILGAILGYAATQEQMSQGIFLLGAYSLGLAVPFVLAAVALGKFFVVFDRMKKHLGLMNKIAGGMLIVVGLLMVTDQFQLLATALAGITPRWLFERL